MSTSASAPVDVAANQTSIASAEQGATSTSIPQTNSELQATQSIYEHAVKNNGMNAVDAVAEPSAGEVTGAANPMNTAVPASSTSQTAQTDGSIDVSSGNRPNGVIDGSIDQGSVAEGSVDASVHSDTEGSRGDATETKKDEENHHTRTNSVKKPTTFSKVSISKNYLAKSAAAPQTAKSGDKPSPAGTPPTLQTARPRLIAKTGASARDGPKTRVGSEAASGPDASKVWNKNRPVQPPPPKQFTDEELKQQYGIHLATRLQTEGDGKDAKWADIDDDEDDWAPDAVVWMDGTKSTLTPQEAATPQPQQKPTSPQPPKPAEAVRPTLAAKRTTELGPAKTILKPGASAAAAQAKQNGAASATPADKSLKAQSPAPPMKSPWAPLPPMDKTSPINPPVQQQQPPQPRLATQDARAYGPPVPQQPAREIAADTFDRSWREGEGGARELFNSVSGRYEPVAEGRRSSIKPDSSMRKPSLLQRSSQSVTSPAEPSAAFQTRSSIQADGSWAGRRGSSVSHSSIPPGRRVSTSKGSDMSPAPERRTSTVVGHDMRSSPQMARAEPAQPNFPQQSAWQQQMPPRPEPGTEAEDPVKVQERVMREKRELAKKRRVEEEKREEAEKQARLKARLAQLEGAGKSRSERAAEAAAAVPAAKPSPPPATELSAEVTTPTAKAEDTRAQPSQPAQVAATVAPELEAQTLPAAPAKPQPKQTRSDDKLPSPLPPKPHFTNLPDRPNSSTEQQRQQSRSHLSPRANNRAPFQGQPSPYGQPTSSYSSPGDRKQHQFNRSPLPNNDTFSSSWPTTGLNSNVWGHSGIGNGTFESSSSFAPMQQTSALPPPPGMSRPSPSNRISPQSLAQGSQSPNMQQQTLQEPHRGFAPPGFEPRPESFANHARVNGTSPIPGLARPPHPPGPIGPPSRAQPQAAGQREDKLKAWNVAAESLPEQYRNAAEAAGKPKPAATTSAPRDDTIKETFKKTTIGSRLGGPRRYGETEFTVHDRQGSRSVQTHSPAPPHAQTQPTGPAPIASPSQQDPWAKAGESKVRLPDTSLSAAQGPTPSQQPPIGRPSTEKVQQTAVQQQTDHAVSAVPLMPVDTVPSPPPPEESSHPVHSGNISHPLVKLPLGKPKVKLPPAPASVVDQQQSVVMPQRPISNLAVPGGSRPLVMQTEWQARFNGLFNRTTVHTETPPSPPKTPPKMQSPALAVAASSRTVMDEMPAATGAMVSLPQAKKPTSREGFTIDDSADVISKPGIEHMFTEELSFGSKPKVSVPRHATYNEALYHQTGPFVMANTRNEFSVEANSIVPLEFRSVHRRHRDGIFIKIPALKVGNKFVRDSRSSRPANAQSDNRKSSGKFNNPKARDGAAVANTNQNNGRENEKNSSPAPTTNSNSAEDTRKKSSNWAKPSRGGGRRPQVQQAVAVNSGW
ncbi:uncharacterized protein LTR77_009219 [Saxophila tyrrhenica]|uniref:Uncharacterized protein n=1 Tax=Saxophila tyrrhenica TaxID=1690608 RepID=A0AAV9P195_9PEZI|nr:hypothetical protein LTR77_009219 [Saxophila tyrrhenica]